jgi:hypothetical protein
MAPKMVGSRSGSSSTKTEEGRMDSLIVVDDFYADPAAVREYCFGTCRFRSAEPYNYPGWEGDKGADPPELRDALSSIVGGEIEVDRERFTWGGFRLITEESGSRPAVHADSGADWAGLVYLSPDAPASCGTGFFRHRATGLEAPPTAAEARRFGFSDAVVFDRDVIRPQKCNPDAWELVSWVAPVYNRLVLFRGRECYHAPLAGFGSTPDNARLTHNFFFNDAPQPGYCSYLEGQRDGVALHPSAAVIDRRGAA